jgi:deoxyribonuclease V
MILAFDTYYFANKAKTVCLAFHNWEDAQEAAVYTELLENIAEYEPGAFYKRELPCILSLLEQINLEEVTAIVVDGFVQLDDVGKPGLGGHLFEALQRKIPVIGVAKTNFATIEQLKRSLLRGESKNPLYITAIGIGLEDATEKIRKMHGEFRIPTLLKRLDGLTKDVTK